MKSLTVEFQRFGDPTGVIRLSDRYIRTIGTTAPAEEVSFAVSQENLDCGMSSLDYSRFAAAAGDPDAVRRTARHFIDDITPHLEEFLLGEDDRARGDGPYQIDIVAHALELAQLPFEILEEKYPELVITRRIRQLWPPPRIIREDTPRVLFAWAEPRRTPRSNRRKEVPHRRHRELLDQLLGDWGGEDGGALVEIRNATRKKLAEALTAKHGFTHVHLLAHGIPSTGYRTPPGKRIDLDRKPPPAMLVALEKEDGTFDQCPPELVARMFEKIPRPETIAIATCHSAEVDSVSSGSTFAHLLHRAGVPVVLASQLALTQDGSDELIRTFLAHVIEGEDPRQAVRECRDALRASAVKTYYDRVALISYIHVDSNIVDRLRERKFKVSLAHLKAITSDAEARVPCSVAAGEVAKVLTQDQRAEAEEIRSRFAKVREKLTALESDLGMTTAQRGELHGLQGSSLKREAEAAWKLGRALPGESGREWLSQSHESLRAAAEAYRRASEISRDHHWTWVQWLVLEAVRTGSLVTHEEDWVAAKAASRDATRRKAGRRATKEERRKNAEQVLWGWGSLCELHLLAPLVGRGEQLSKGRKCLDRLVRGSRALSYQSPIDSTLAQLDRYGSWWGADSQWKIPADTVEHARELHDYLQALSQSD